ncbi:MAG: helix-turn-helix domain-containing protein [Monoglobales bacterium]|uniref:helix-turn-helix domain-containing protein n=1 Tax=Candidatus Ventrimonas sp. TaxID=3048889 RepID=UPI003A11FA04
MTTADYYTWSQTAVFCYFCYRLSSTAIKAHEGDPIAIQAVLDRCAGYIRCLIKMNGYYNSDMEDYYDG